MEPNSMILLELCLTLKKPLVMVPAYNSTHTHTHTDINRCIAGSHGRYAISAESE